MSTEEGLPTAHRNTAGLIDHAEGYFGIAHHHGLMALYAEPRQGREVDIVFDGFPAQRVTDFVRCSYLGLDNHPLIVDGAIEALKACRALHWSCARTRLNFAILRDLETALADLFQARIITYTTVLAANMGALPIVASGHLTGGIRPLMAFDRHAHATLAFHKGTIALETEVRTIAHNDLNMLEDLCKTNKSVAYVCDGVYSMGGNARWTICSRCRIVTASFFMSTTLTGFRYGENAERVLPGHTSAAISACVRSSLHLSERVSVRPVEC